MGLKLYLTIAAVVAIIYALAFLVIPVQASLLFSSFAEPRAVLYLRFCGAAVLAWGLIVWFARDFREWAAVRGVLIASIIGLAINIIIFGTQDAKAIVCFCIDDGPAMKYCIERSFFSCGTSS